MTSRDVDEGEEDEVGDVDELEVVDDVAEEVDGGGVDEGDEKVEDSIPTFLKSFLVFSFSAGLASSALDLVQQLDPELPREGPTAHAAVQKPDLCGLLRAAAARRCARLPFLPVTTSGSVTSSVSSSSMPFSFMKTFSVMKSASVVFTMVGFALCLPFATVCHSGPAHSTQLKEIGSRALAGVLVPVPAACGQFAEIWPGFKQRKHGRALLSTRDFVQFLVMCSVDPQLTHRPSSTRAKPGSRAGVVLGPLVRCPLAVADGGCFLRNLLKSLPNRRPKTSKCSSLTSGMSSSKLWKRASASHSDSSGSATLRLGPRLPPPRCALSSCSHSTSSSIWTLIHSLTSGRFVKSLSTRNKSLRRPGGSRRRSWPRRSL